jgi:hypothetical protein
VVFEFEVLLFFENEKSYLFFLLSLCKSKKNRDAKSFCPKAKSYRAKTFGNGFKLDAVKVVNAYANNDPKAGEYARKAGLNTTVALGSAAIPVVGWMVGGIYFVGDAFIPKDGNGVGGWERAGNVSQQNLESNRAIDPRWSARPMGGL